MRKKRNNHNSLLAFNNDIPSLYTVNVIKNGSDVSENLLLVILQRFFNNSPISEDGDRAQFGFYTRDIAETKIKDITDFVDTHNMKLKCIVERKVD